MKTFIRVKGDTNDADYVESFKEISPEDLQLIMPVIEAIKNLGTTNREHRYNWNTSEYCHGEKGPAELYIPIVGELAYDAFAESYVPWGIHTIGLIELYQVADHQRLL